jgi:lysozyme
VSVVSRWRGKLSARTLLLERANRSVRYWSQRAGSSHGRDMLRTAVALRALRRTQVAEARRVLARHSEVTQVSAEGLAFIAGFEGFRSHPYRDAVGVWTVGYGETRGIGPGTRPWTREYALGRLKVRVNHDYLEPVLRVARSVGLDLASHEADALASLVYNLGPGILDPGHTMGDAVRSNSRARIANAFLVYDKAGSPPRALAGLTRRRQAERHLFLNGGS